MSLNKKKIAQRIVKQNKSKEYPFLNLFLLIAIIAEVLAQILDAFLFKLMKPIPILMMIFYISGKNSIRDHLLPGLIQCGLIISLCGDSLLLINEQSSFVIGTFCFLITHILYSIALSIGQQVRQSSLQNKIFRYFGCIGLVILSCGYLYFIWNSIPNKYLYSIYEIVLCSMGILSLLRYEKTTSYSFRFMLIGATLLGISHNFTGYSKFKEIQSSFGNGISMLAYFSGQYLLMHGALHHSNLQNQITKFLKYKCYRD